MFLRVCVRGVLKSLKVHVCVCLKISGCKFQKEFLGVDAQPCIHNMHIVSESAYVVKVSPHCVCTCVR